MWGHGRRGVREPGAHWWSGRPRLIAGVVVVLLLAGASVYVAYDVIKARSALLRAESQAQALKQQISAGDVNSAQASLRGLQASTSSARSHSDGLAWKVSASLPVIGQNFEAVGSVSRVLEEIAVDGLPSVVNGNVDANTFKPKNGRVDIDAMEQLAPGLANLDRSVSAGLRDLDGIESQSLFGTLREPYERLHRKLTDAQRASSAGATALKLMPSMLGGSDRRTYIMAVQNNAEVRSTGGIPGAFAFVRARDGRLSIGKQGAATDFGYYDPPVVKLSRDERALYSKLMASYWVDTTFTPDFPRTAQIMRAMVAKEFDRSVDGVISVDPIALSYVLRGTGPITLSDGKSLSSRNAVKLFLNDVYLTYAKSPAKQDAYFADAARRVFAAVAAGKGDQRAIITGLARAVDENRILINSTREAEQSILAATRVGGALTRHASSSPHVGLYLNDSTTTKLEYYLKKQTQMSSVACDKDGIQTLTTTTVLHSDVPSDVSTLPKSILGPGTGEKRGSIRMNLRFYAPLGGSVTNLRVNEQERTVNRGSDGDLQVAILPVLLAPGQTVTVTSIIESGRDQRDDAVFSTTPGVDRTPNNVKVPSKCTG